MILNRHEKKDGDDIILIKRKPLQNTEQIHPESVVKATKYLRTQYPGLYPLISGYANCRHLDEVEEAIVSARSTVRGFDWQLIRPFFLQFCNVEKVKSLNEDEEENGKQARLPASTYLTTSGSGEVSRVRKEV